MKYTVAHKQAINGTWIETLATGLLSECLQHVCTLAGCTSKVCLCFCTCTIFKTVVFLFKTSIFCGNQLVFELHEWTVMPYYNNYSPNTHHQVVSWVVYELCLSFENKRYSEESWKPLTSMVKWKTNTRNGSWFPFTFFQISSFCV